MTREEVKKILDQQLELLAERSKKEHSYQAKIELTMAILEIANSKVYKDLLRFTFEPQHIITIDGNDLASYIVPVSKVNKKSDQNTDSIIMESEA